MSRKKLILVTDERQLPLTDSERKLLDEIIQGFIDRRSGALRYTEKTIRSDMAVIMDFLSFAGKAPWDCTPNDFDQWCASLYSSRTPGKRLAPESQRKYQTAVQQFFRYFVENVHFANEIRNRFGVRPIQIVTDENKIPHLDENHRENERPALSREQIAMFFDAIDAQIVEAHRFSSKEFRPLQRDKAFFYAVYALGLRISEGCGLNLDSFSPNPNLPQLGPFGFATVKGKGSRGTGPKIRTVPVDHPMLPPILGWYIKEVRPTLLRKADPNDRALFFNERGSRVKVSGMEYRFQKLLGYAGLDGLGFTPHSLRHSYTTHSNEMGMSLEYLRRKLGHVFSATTDGYLNFGDDYIRGEGESAVTSMLDRFTKNEGGEE